MVEINVTPKTPITPHIPPITIMIENSEVEIEPNEELVIKLNDLLVVKVKHLLNVCVGPVKTEVMRSVEVWTERGIDRVFMKGINKNVVIYHDGKINEKEIEEKLEIGEEEIEEVNELIRRTIQNIGLAYYLIAHYAGQ